MAPAGRQATDQNIIPTAEHLSRSINGDVVRMDDTRNIKVCSGGQRGGMSLTKNAGRTFQTEHSICRPWDSGGEH